MAFDTEVIQIDQICHELGNKQHLKRLQAVKKLQNILNGGNCQEAQIKVVQNSTLELLASNDYQKVIGGFMATQMLIPLLKNSAFLNLALENCIQHLEDEELRVRQEVCEVLYQISKEKGSCVLDQKKHYILHSIQRCYDRDSDEAAKQQQDNVTIDLKEAYSQKNYVDSLLQAYNPPKPGQGEMRHHTEGWKSLETSIKCIQNLAKGTAQYIQNLNSQNYQHCKNPQDDARKSPGKDHQPTPSRYQANQQNQLQVYEQGQLDQLLDTNLLGVIKMCSLHQSRFVRETANYTQGVIAESVSLGRLLEIKDTLAESLQDGLSDNWSQVRYSACVASRQFLTRFSHEYISRELAQIIACLCINRYYVADGVKNHALETWKLVMKDQGKKVIADNFDVVLRYYITQTKANNHAIREAACMSLKEIVVKIPPDVVQKHIDTILYTLIKTLKDNSWPVRDAACVALGSCVQQYREQSREIKDSFLKLCLEQLSENIPAVRENSASSIALVYHAYKDEVKDMVLKQLREDLGKAQMQPQQELLVQFGSYTGLQNNEKDNKQQNKLKNQDYNIKGGTSHQGIDGPQRSADTAQSTYTHTPTQGPKSMQAQLVDNIPTQKLKDNQQQLGQIKQINQPNEMFAESSIVTKKRGLGSVDTECCIDAGYTRQKQLWEYTDGAVYLLKDISNDIEFSDMEKFLESLEQLLKIEHYQQANNLKCTIYKCLPQIAQKMGKRQFKVFLPNFIPYMFKSLECGHLNCQAAAGKSIGEFRDLLGPTIFQARLDETQKQKMNNINIPSGSIQ